MDRVILMMDTGRTDVRQAAVWFMKRGDTVYLASKTEPADLPSGAQYLPMDGQDPESLTAAVRAVEAAYGRLDIFVMGTVSHPHDGAIGTGHDYEVFADTMMENAYGARMALEAFLPLLRKGMKRVACITKQESSNTYGCGTEDMAYWASAAALNMTGKMFFNQLRPEGFTFRWFCDDEQPGGICAAEYIASGLCYDPKEPYIHSDENRLVLRNKWLQEIPW